MTTLVNLRAALVDQLGLLSIDQMIPTDSLTRSINYGLQRLSRELDWPHLQRFDSFDTVVGQNLYDFPDDDLKAIITLGIEQYRLSYITFGELITYFNYQNSPSVFTIEGSQIYLAPTPSIVQTVDIAYSLGEKTLSADSDTPYLPSNYDDILILFAAQHQAARLKDASLMQMISAQIAQLMKPVLQDYYQTLQTPRIQMRKDTNPRVF